ncbi:hypothetical protein [Pantanalinema sp. GBBB05]|uniref:hypothetical protein n=1 Tax=Pantanalinema sp. GBBB05 TaxID=2604139 RepID=UPI001D6221FB|nr:hypothetical protein [Pantanalinema sp. GBBB05]
MPKVSHLFWLIAPGLLLVSGCSFSQSQSPSSPSPPSRPIAQPSVSAQPTPTATVTTTKPASPEATPFITHCDMQYLLENDMSYQRVQSILGSPGQKTFDQRSQKYEWKWAIPIQNGFVFHSYVGYVRNGKFRYQGMVGDRPEFKRVKDGMSIRQVEAILGKPQSVIPERTVQYNWPCRDDLLRTIKVIFVNDASVGTGLSWSPDQK